MLDAALELGAADVEARDWREAVLVLGGRGARAADAEPLRLRGNEIDGRVVFVDVERLRGGRRRGRGLAAAQVRGHSSA